MFSTVSLQKDGVGTTRSLLTQIRVFFPPVAESVHKQTTSQPEARPRSGIDDELCESNPFAAQLLQRLHYAESQRLATGKVSMSRQIAGTESDHSAHLPELLFALLAVGIVGAAFDVYQRPHFLANFSSLPNHSLALLGLKALAQGMCQAQSRGRRCEVLHGNLAERRNKTQARLASALRNLNAQRSHARSSCLVVGIPWSFSPSPATRPHHPLQRLHRGICS